MSEHLETFSSTTNGDPINEKTIVLPAPSYQNLDAEKVLQELGKFGVYQIMIYMMVAINVYIFAVEIMIISLISKNVEFSCLSNNTDFEVIDKCTVKSFTNNKTFTCGKISQTHLIFDESARDSLTGEFELVCDKAYWTQHATSIFMLASQFTTPVIALLSDKYGRRWTFLFPLWICVIANFCCSLASNYYLFLAARFFAGVGSAGMGTVGYVIQIETMTPSFRSMSPLFGTFIWVFGYISVGVLHIFIPNWRWLYFWVSVPGVITFSYCCFMPESIHWLITNNKPKEVKRYIKKSCRINRREIKLNECQSETRMDEKNVSETKQSFLSILKSRPLIFNFVIYCYILTVMKATYWVLSLFSVELHENEMVGYFFSAFTELPTGFIAVGLLYYFGRRSLTFISLFGQSVCMFFAILFPGKTFISMVFPLMAKVFNLIAWTALPLLAGEMSPTVIRNMFFGYSGFISDIGSILPPYTNVLKEIHESAPAFLICGLSIFAAIASLCLPETRGKSLPETIEDFDPGTVYNWIFGKEKKRENVENIEDAKEVQTKNEESLTLLKEAE